MSFPGLWVNEKVEVFMAAKRKLGQAFALGVLLLPRAGALREEAKSTPLPEQVSRYYDGCNFVCSYSTKD